MFFKIRVERPQAGQARICVLDPDGEIEHEFLETDPTKADAMTNALENAEGGSKLGVDIGPGA